MTRATPLALLLALSTPAAAATPTKGTWWEQSVQTEMKGMPMAMPPQVMKVCAGEDDWSKPPEQGPNCKFTMLENGSSSAKWKVSCTGKDAMEGTGESSWTKDTSQGTMVIHSKQGDMVMKQRGRRLGGDCNPAEEEAKREAQYAENKAKGAELDAQHQERQAKQAQRRCEEGVERMRASNFEGHSACQDAGVRRRFCDRLQTRQGYVASEYESSSSSGKGNTAAAGRLCQVEIPALEHRLCAEALKGNDLVWLGGHCPVEVKVVLKRECAGRDYTSTAERYRDFCASAAATAMQGPSATGEAGPRPRGKTKPSREAREATEEAEPAKAEKPADKSLEKGKALLKGVLGF